MNWTVIIVSIVIGNLLIIGLLGGGFFYIKRRKEKMAENLGDEITEADTANSQPDTPEVKEEHE